MQRKTSPARQQKMARIPKSKGVAAPQANNSVKAYWLVALCLLMAFGAYLPVFQANFVNWDDSEYVVENLTIRSFTSMKEILFTPVQGNYHPVTMLSLAVNYAISGLSPTSYHLVNLLLHLLNILLVFFFVYRLTGKKIWIAWVTALLFAVHPLHAESVAWVSERKDVLYSFFFLAGLILYLRFLENRTVNRFLAVFFLFILSLLSKPSAIVFPLVLILIDLYYGRLRETRSWFEKLPFLLFSFAFGLLTLHGQSMTDATQYSNMIPGHFKFFFGFYGSMMYLVKTLVPVGLCAFYPYPAVNESLPAPYYAAFFVFVLTAALLIIKFRNHRLVIFAALFYLVNLILVLQFFPVGSAIIADRYAYLPVIGPFLIFGVLLQSLGDRNSGKPPVWSLATLGVIAVVLMILTFRQASTWRSSEDLWDQAIRVNPSSKAYTNRGFFYKKDGQQDKALEFFSSAIRINGADKDALVNRGDLYFGQQKFDLAIADYSQCLRIFPDVSLALQNRGAAYSAIGKYDLARIDMDRALALNPASKVGYANRALLEQSLQRYQQAIDDFYRHMQYSPDTTGDVWNAIGVSWLRMNQKEKALACFDKAIQLSGNPVFKNNRLLALPEHELAEKRSNRQTAH